MSKDTLKSYQDKAVKTPPSKNGNWVNRIAGVARSAEKLKKEEVEQIEEISKGTAINYLSKKLKDNKHAFTSDFESKTSEKDKKSINRALKKSGLGDESKVNEGKDPNMDGGVGSAPNFVQPENPSSNPVMNRIKDVTKNAMSKIKTEMLGKAPGNN